MKPIQKPSISTAFVVKAHRNLLIWRLEFFGMTRFSGALWAIAFSIASLGVAHRAQAQCAPLAAGTYTVGQPQAQFAQLEQALEALRCGGSTGPVTLQLLPGLYNGHYVLDSLPAGTQHLLTLRGGVDVRFVRPAEALVPGSISLRSGRWRLEQLTFLRNAQVRTAAPLLSVSGGIRPALVNNRFVSEVNDQRADALAIAATGTDSLRIDSNTFMGWHRAIALQNGSGLQFVQNQISDFTGTFMDARQWQGLNISANRFADARQLLPLVQAFRLVEVSGLQFSANSFTGSLPQQIMHLDRPLKVLGAENRVFNNEINGHWLPESVTQQAVLFWFDARQSSQDLEALVLHNSLRLVGSRDLSAASLVRLTGWRLTTDSLLFANNLLAVEAVPGSNQPLPYLVSADTLRLPGLGLFNNSYARPDSSQAFWLANTTNALSFGQWRTLAGYDAASVWGNPLWRQPEQALLPAQQAINGAGFAFPWPAVDITGLARSIPPDPGAREFEALQRELRLGELFTSGALCGSAALQRVGFTLYNVGTEAYQQLPIRLLRNGQSVSFMRLPLVQAAGSFTAFFPDSVLVGGTQAVQLEARIDTLADTFAANDTVRLQLPASQPVFPAQFTVEQQAAGSLTLGSPWTQQQGQNAFWQVHVGAQGTAIAADASGNAQGRYLLLTEHSNPSMSQTDSVELLWDCLSLQSLSIPELSFQYHRASRGARLRVLVRVSGQWQLLEQITPASTTAITHDWLHRRVLLPATADALRLSLLVPAGSRPFWALDQVQLGETVIEDLQLDSLSLQLPACQSSGDLVVTGYLRNSSLGIISALRLGGRLGNQPAVLATANRVLLPGATDTVQLRLSFTQAGNYALRVYAANTSDQFFVNDSLSVDLTLRGTVSQYPYADDFEVASEWTPGGIFSSWQRSRPQASRLNQAGSGQWAWVTAPQGQPNVGERSWVQSPCLNLSSLLRPRLEFLLWYDLGNEGRAWVEYESAPGVWTTLGAAFTGTQWYNAPGTQAAWRGSSNGWIVVSHDLEALQGLTSTSLRVVYQAPADSLLQAQPIEGVAFDSMRITESPGSFVANWQAAGESCIPMARQVTATVARASQLQQIELRYRVNGAAEQVVPMTASGSTYTASIPAQLAGAWVSYRIQTLSDTLLSTPVRWYTDGFFGIRLPDVTGPSRLPVTVDPGVSSGGDLAVATGANDTASAAWIEVEALRYTELEGVWVQTTAFTSVRVFGQVAAASGDSLRYNQLALLGSLQGIAAASNHYVSFSNRPAMRPGQKLILYIESAVPGSLRVAKTALPAVTQDASIAVRPGRWLAQAGATSSGNGMPVVRVISRNPASSVAWQSMQGAPVSSQLVYSRTLGLTADSLVFRLERSGCVYTDTIAFIPTGQFDLAVTEILEPQLPQVQLGVFYPVKVVLANRGNLPVNEAQLAYRVNGAELAVTPLTRSLAPNDTMHFTFPQLWTWVEGNSIVMCAYPRSFNLDVQRSNDTSCVARFPTSVHETQAFSLRLYPQPASEQVFLDLTEPLGSPAQWQLYDALGRKLLSRILEAGERNFVFPLQSIANGMYYYSLQTEGLVRSGKLLIGK